MSISKLSVKVLSASVKSQDDVFDHLVEVQRLDTMETGLLLCSHCCRWPAHLIHQATWIEGCYTPAQYKLDSRLLMGYHPQTMTNWEYEETPEGIFVHLTVSEYVSNDLDGWEDLPELHIDGSMPLPLCPTTQEPTHMVGTRIYRHLRRVWREVNRTRQGTEALLVFFRTVYAMVDNGSLNELAVTSCISNFEEIMQAIFLLDGQYNVQFGRRSPLDGTPTEVYADAIGVVSDMPSAGYLTPVGLLNYYGGRRGRRRNTPANRAVVSNEAIIWGVPGYALAVPLTYFDYVIDEFDQLNGDGWYVNCDVPELGFYKAVELQSFVPYNDGLGYYVNECDADQGYWIADVIH